MKKIGLTMLLLLLTFPIIAQDGKNGEGGDYAQYGDVFEITFSQEGQQELIQFEGSAGDWVYLSGDQVDAGSVIQINFEIRDSNGLRISFGNDAPFDSFALAQLPADGVYTAVMTYDTFGEAIYRVRLNQTLNLAEVESSQAIFQIDNPPDIFYIEVSSPGYYDFMLDRVITTDQPIELQVMSFERASGRTIARFSGEDIESWRVTLGLNPGVQYVLYIKSNVFSTAFLSDSAIWDYEYTVRLRASER